MGTAHPADVHRQHLSKTSITAVIFYTCTGFRLDTLLKLAGVKGTDRKTSLLHFVLDQLLKESPAMLSLPQQLFDIKAAANLQASLSNSTMSRKWLCPLLCIACLFTQCVQKSIDSWCLHCLTASCVWMTPQQIWHLLVTATCCNVVIRAGLPWDL